MKFNKLIPELKVSSLKDSLNFYVGILGFKVEYERKESRFVFISFQGSQIMIEEINDTWKTGLLEKPFGRGVNFQIEVNSIKPLLDNLKHKKQRLFQEPKDNWYRKGNSLMGNREFLIQDPDGYLLRFYEHLGSKPVK
jgi:catechol 2,3-dioxygenase-like lactoylglutathione lyase family enzyme